MIFVTHFFYVLNVKESKKNLPQRRNTMWWCGRPQRSKGMPMTAVARQQKHKDRREGKKCCGGGVQMREQDERESVF